MCGIFGHIDWQGSAQESLVRRMAQRVAGRLHPQQGRAAPRLNAGDQRAGKAVLQQAGPLDAGRTENLTQGGIDRVAFSVGNDRGQHRRPLSLCEATFYPDIIRVQYTRV